MDAYNATLIRRTEVTPRLLILQVRPDDAGFAFVAGQYVTLGLARNAPRVPEADPDPDAATAPDAGRLIRRAYSIASGSRNRDFLEFIVSLVSSGALTPRLFALAPGDRLHLGARAKGLFTLDRISPRRNLLMVATGTGLAPYMSMLRTHVIGTPEQPVAVLHGASYSWDLGYRGELMDLRRSYRNFAYVPVISRPDADPDWSGLTGRLPAWLERVELAAACGFAVVPETTHVLLCGNPGMIEASLPVLEGRGFTLDTSPGKPGTLHVEKYW